MTMRRPHVGAPTDRRGDRVAANHTNLGSAASIMLLSKSSRRVFFGFGAGLVMSMLLLLCARSVSGNEVRGMSFYPPFQSFNARGERTVSSFTFTGATLAKQSFARITPDTTDTYGSMFSRLTNRFNTDLPGGQFSMALSYRVSGAVEKHHGKYLALVIGNPDTIRRRGDTYGWMEDFVGMGVVISMRPPADMSEPKADKNKPAGPRQFVSFFANNGTRSTEEVRTLASSCSSTVRYYEGRDDFNFLKSSRVRLGFYDGEVTLEMDSRNLGVWRKCISITVQDMPVGWLNRAGVAITAENGIEVSNNHDVMSLQVFTERDEAFNTAMVDGSSIKDEDAGEEAEEEARKKRLYAIRAHLEHEFDSVERILKDSVDKLAVVNEDIMKRMTRVEKTVSLEAFSLLNRRVKDIEARVKQNAGPALENRIREAEDDFHDDMGETMERLLEKGTGWKLPFFLMLGVIASLAIFSAKQYRRLMRSNFLGSFR